MKVVRKKINKEDTDISDNVLSESVLRDVIVDKNEVTESIKDQLIENSNSEKCVPRKNLVYLKTHKTASSAVQVHIVLKYFFLN